MKKTINCDICVIGGGLAGTFDAIQAARQGSKVVLMQDRPMLGGNASSEIRMWVRGAKGKFDRESGLNDNLSGKERPVSFDVFSGKNFEMLGLVKGSTIQSKHLGKDIAQSFKTLVGGELKAYNEMMNEARALATKRMVEEAEALGADAIVNIRYSSAAVMQGAAEVISYGTAVKFI